MDVVKGAFGFLVASVSLISFIVKVLLVSQTFSTLSFSLSLKTSPGYFILISFPDLFLVSALIFQ